MLYQNSIEYIPSISFPCCHAVPLLNAVPSHHLTSSLQCFTTTQYCTFPSCTFLAAMMYHNSITYLPTISFPHYHVVPSHLCISHYQSDCFTSLITMAPLSSHISTWCFIVFILLVSMPHYLIVLKPHYLTAQLFFCPTVSLLQCIITLCFPYHFAHQTTDVLFYWTSFSEW